MGSIKNETGRERERDEASLPASQEEKSVDPFRAVGHAGRDVSLSSSSLQDLTGFRQVVKPQMACGISW